MKVWYRLADDRFAEIEVSGEVAKLLADYKREDENFERNITRRCDVSLNKLNELGFEPEDQSVDVLAEVLRRETKNELLKAMGYLSKKQQRLITLYYYEEKTEAEIAKEFGVHQSCINRQLKTILKKIKNIL